MYKGSYKEVNTLTASDVESYDHFGISSSLSSDGLVLVVGAFTKDTVGVDAGKVYTYKRDSVDDEWSEVNTLTASDANDNSYFGLSVSISDDGLVLVVSADKEDSFDSNNGKVYTYKRDTIDDEWSEVNALITSDINDIYLFGRAVSLSGDGLVLAVGVIYGDSDINGGKVYTYKRDTIDDEWTEVNTLTASDAENNDLFGITISLSSDGLVLVVGGVFEGNVINSIGKLYTYKRNSIDDEWTEANTLIASDTEDDSFGMSVAIANNGLIMAINVHDTDVASKGIGKIYIYKRYTINDEWDKVNIIPASDTEDNNIFGISVTLSNNASVLSVGAFGKDDGVINGGKIYTYKYINT